MCAKVLSVPCLLILKRMPILPLRSATGKEHLGQRDRKMAATPAGNMPLPLFCRNYELIMIIRRRKVRCNEQRPRCSHCERLNLECTWNRVSMQKNESSSAELQPGLSQQAHLMPLALGGYDSSQFSAIFNSTWDEAMLLSPSSWPNSGMTVAPGQEPLLGSMAAMWTPPLPSPTHNMRSPEVPMPATELGLRQESGSTAPISTHLSSEESPTSMDDGYLLESFLQIFMPPILAPVEIGPKLSTTRAFFASMSSKSSMVRLAVMAFSAFQLSRSQSGIRIDYQPFYESASRELRTALAAGNSSVSRQKSLEHFLAAIFLLTYADVN
jgi:hypothetical protein